MLMRTLTEQNAASARPGCSSEPTATTTGVVKPQPLLRNDTICFSGFEFVEDIPDDKDEAEEGVGDDNTSVAHAPSEQTTLRLADCVAMAEQLGATVQRHLKRSTTWLVAARGLTTKRVMAEGIGIPVVAPGWLRALLQIATSREQAHKEGAKDEEEEVQGELVANREDAVHTAMAEARKRFLVPPLSGYVFSTTRLSEEEVQALRELLGTRGATVSNFLSSSCDALLLSTDDAMAIRRGLHRLPQKPRKTDSDTMASPLAVPLGAQLTEKLLFAWRRGIPVLPYDQLLQSIRGLEEDPVSDEAKMSNAQTLVAQQIGQRRRARWSAQMDMDALCAAFSVQAPPTQWLSARHEDDDDERTADRSPAAADREEVNGKHEERHHIGPGFVSRPFVRHPHARSDLSAPHSPASTAASDADTVSAAMLSASFSSASCTTSSRSSSLSSSLSRSLHGSEADAMESSGPSQQQPQPSFSFAHPASPHRALDFVLPGENSLAVVETCASDALVTQPDYFSAPHSDKHNKNTISSSTNENDSLGRDVSAYYALKRAKPTHAAVLEVLPPLTRTGLLATVTNPKNGADDAFSNKYEKVIVGEEDEEEEEEHTAAERRRRGKLSLSYWRLAPRNPTAHLHVALMGCTADELRQGVAACFVCRFLRTPFPTSQTDIVILGSELLKKKKFVDTSARSRRGAHTAPPRPRSLRQNAQQQQQQKATSTTRAASEPVVRVFYTCHPDILDELEMLYGIAPRHVVPLSWLRACLRVVQEKQQKQQQQRTFVAGTATTASPRAKERCVALPETPVYNGTQDDGAEETARWPSELLGPQPRLSSAGSDEIPKAEENAEEAGTEEDANVPVCFQPEPPLALDELPNPRDRHFRIQRRAAAFVEPALTAATPSALVAPTTTSTASAPVATPPADVVEVQAEGVTVAKAHTPEARPSHDSNTSQALSASEVQYTHDRERAARVLTGFIDLLVPTTDIFLPGGARSTVGQLKAWKQAQLVEAHALDALTVCLVDGDFARSDLAVARGLINLGRGRWVKKTSAAWRTLLLKRSAPTRTATARDTAVTQVTGDAKGELADEKEVNSEEDSTVVHVTRSHAAYGKRAAKWWHRKHMLLLPTAVTNATAAASEHETEETGENVVSSPSSDLATQTVAQLHKLASTCVSHPVVRLVPHAHQRTRDDAQSGNELANSMHHKPSLSGGGQNVLRFLCPVTTDYLLCCLACGKLLNPQSCFVFHTPLPSAPDMKLLQHARRRAAQDTPSTATTAPVDKTKPSSLGVAAAGGGAKPPAISPWVWERRYAKTRAVGVTVFIVWRIAEDSLVPAEEADDKDANGTERVHMRARQQHASSASCSPPRSTAESRVPNPETAVLMRALLFSLHHVITALGGALTDVFDPAAVTHVLLVDVETIRQSTWQDMYHGARTHATHCAVNGDEAGRSAGGGCCWPTEEVQKLAVHCSSPTAASCVFPSDKAATEEVVCAVTLDWLAASVQWGVFVHEETSESCRWAPRECLPASVRHRGDGDADGVCFAREGARTPSVVRTHEATRRGAREAASCTPRAVRQRQAHIAQQLAQVRAGLRPQESLSSSTSPSQLQKLSQRGHHSHAEDEEKQPETHIRVNRAHTPPPSAVSSSLPWQPQDALSRQSCCTPPPPLPAASQSQPHEAHTTHTTGTSASISPRAVSVRTPLPHPHSRSSSTPSRSFSQAQHNTQSLAEQEEKDRFLITHLCDRFRYNTPAATPVRHRHRSTPSQEPFSLSEREEPDMVGVRALRGSSAEPRRSVQVSPSPVVQNMSQTPRRPSLREQSAAMSATHVSALALATINSAVEAAAVATTREGTRHEAQVHVLQTDSHQPLAQLLSAVKRSRSHGHHSEEKDMGHGVETGARDDQGEHQHEDEEPPVKKPRLSARALHFSHSAERPSSSSSSSSQHRSGQAGEGEEQKSTLRESSPPSRVLAPDSFVAASPTRTDVTALVDGQQSVSENAELKQAEARAPHSPEGASQARRSMTEELMLLAAGSIDGESHCGSRGRPTSARTTVDLPASATLDPHPCALQEQQQQQQSLSLAADDSRPRLGLATSRSTTPPPRRPSQPVTSVVVVADDDDDEVSEGDEAVHAKQQQQHQNPHLGNKGGEGGVSPGQISLARRGVLSADRTSPVPLRCADKDTHRDEAEARETGLAGVVAWRSLRVYVLHDVPLRDALMQRCERLLAQLPRGLAEEGEHARDKAGSEAEDVTSDAARHTTRACLKPRPRKRARSGETHANSALDPQNDDDDDDEEEKDGHGRRRSPQPKLSPPPIEFVARCEEADVVVTHEITPRETVLTAVAAGLYVVRPTALDDIASRLGRCFDRFHLAIPNGAESRTSEFSLSREKARAIAALNADILRWLDVHEWGPEYLPHGAPEIHVQLARQCRVRRRDAQQHAWAAMVMMASMTPPAMATATAGLWVSPAVRTGLFAHVRFLLFLAPTRLTNAPSPLKGRNSDGSGDGTASSSATPSKNNNSSNASSASSSPSQEQRRMEKRFGAVHRLITAGGGAVSEVVMLRDAAHKDKNASTTLAASVLSLPTSAASLPAAVLTGTAQSANAGTATDTATESSENYLAQLIVKALLHKSNMPMERDEAKAMAPAAVPTDVTEIILLLDTPLLTASLLEGHGTLPGNEAEHTTVAKTNSVDAGTPLVSWMTQQLQSRHSDLIAAIKASLAAQRDAMAAGSKELQPQQQQQQKRKSRNGGNGHIHVRLSLRSFSWLARHIAGDVAAEKTEGGTFSTVDLNL